jgi:PKD repeat protein
MKTKLIFLNVLFVLILASTGCMKKPMACCDFASTGTVGTAMSFSSTCSMDADNYSWDFGDGGTSTEANPSHTYTTAGTYTVKIMAMSKNGKKMDETTKTVTIN